MVNALVERLLSWRCFNGLRIPPDNFEFWHDSFLQYRPDGIKHLDSNVCSKAMEMPSPDFLIPRYLKQSTSKKTPCVVHLRLRICF